MDSRLWACAAGALGGLLTVLGALGWIVRRGRA